MKVFVSSLISGFGAERQAARRAITTLRYEALTTYDYGPDSGPNNLLLRGQLVSGGGVSARTCYAYDSNGNRISETGPGAALASCP